MNFFHGALRNLLVSFHANPLKTEATGNQFSYHWAAALTGVLLSSTVLVVLYAWLFPFFASASAAFSMPVIPVISFLTLIALATTLTAPFHRMKVKWAGLASSLGGLVLAQSLMMGLMTVAFHAGDAQEIVLALLGLIFLAGIMWQAVLLHNTLCSHLKCPSSLSALLAGIINLAALGHSVYLWYKVLAVDSLEWDSLFFA